MKVALTGATGMLGGALAKAYHERGDDVIALVRQSSDTSNLVQHDVELIYGELNDENAFHKLLRDADLGIHCAALTKDFGPWEEFLKINVGGTQLFLETCQQLNIQRVLYISSVVVYGNGKHHRGTDEDGPYETIIIDNYTRSKIMADRLAFQYHQEQDLPVTIIRPGYIWGPGDRAVMPLLIEGIRKKQLAVVDGGVNIMNLTHIDNLVEGVMLAADSRDAIGKAFNITDGSKVTTIQFLKDIIEILGIDYKIRSFPYVPVYVIAYLCEIYARLRRYKIRPPITRYTVRISEFDQVFDISRAMYELGYKPKIYYKNAMAMLTHFIRSLYYKGK